MISEQRKWRGVLGEHLAAPEQLGKGKSHDTQEDARDPSDRLRPILRPLSGGPGGHQLHYHRAQLSGHPRLCRARPGRRHVVCGQAPEPDHRRQRRGGRPDRALARRRDQPERPGDRRARRGGRQRLRARLARRGDRQQPARRRPERRQRRLRRGRRRADGPNCFLGDDRGRVLHGAFPRGRRRLPLRRALRRRAGPGHRRGHSHVGHGGRRPVLRHRLRSKATPR